MATGYIYTALAGVDNGKWQERDGVRGILILYAGVEFWLPLDKVTAIPDWTFRELDHDKSTAATGERSELVYKTVMVRGGRVVDELVRKQIPIPYIEMGVIPVEGKRTGKTLVVPSGTDEDGRKLTAEVPEVEPWQKEVREAERLAKYYKERIIQDYLMSKRERMNGGKGRTFPDPTVRLYMEELGIEDIDDVSAHGKRTQGVDPGLISTIVEAVRQATEVNATKLHEAVDSVRKSGQAQLRSNSKSEPVQDVTREPEVVSEKQRLARLAFTQRAKDRFARLRAEKAGGIAVEEPPKGE